MIGRGDHDDVEIRLIEQAAIVGVFLGLRIFLGGGRQALLVDVAQRDDVFRSDVFDVIGGLGGHADGADIQLLVRRAPGGQGRAWPDNGHRRGRSGAGQRGLTKKLATRKWRACHRRFPAKKCFW